MRAGKKQIFNFKGNNTDSSILVGSHGDAVFNVEGYFDLSGIIYCPKYTVTFNISGSGTLLFRGICHRVIIRRMSGNCKMDLTDFTCKELQCDSMRQQSKLITGKLRVITKANLKDQAVLQLSEKPLITSAMLSGNSRILQPSEAE